MPYSKDSIAKIREMSELRDTIDRLDSDLIALLKLRFQCMNAAARIKSEKSAVRDEKRKAEVLENVKQLASAAGIPVPTMAAIWEMLIETSISYELEKWDQIRGS
ncbi:chorismate mutase [Parasphingorhabdus cellanae]|uniref:chorismate mutase n=1 Tax=Parasphingorhabdus cellanae TaxID=2806553 RepID=A0ABX7T338_9SPHN|nr:chorismate mutase [Parasphingorhabdus cellanae]QTD55951.1 chorismate mutase [Parasphingorhabdus cellanae]